MIILMCIKLILFLSLILSLPLSALRLMFSQAGYEGNEGPDRRSSLPSSPCRVLVRLVDTIIEEDLRIRLIPQTFPENIAINGPPSRACVERLGFNASSKSMWLHYNWYLPSLEPKLLEHKRTALSTACAWTVIPSNPQTTIRCTNHSWYPSIWKATVRH